MNETNWLICRHCGQGPRYLRMPNGRIEELNGHAAGCPVAAALTTPATSSPSTTDSTATEGP